MASALMSQGLSSGKIELTSPIERFFDIISQMHLQIELVGFFSLSSLKWYIAIA